MSAGVFIRSRYAADYGDGASIHPIRVQPETIAMLINAEQNAPPAGGITNPISAYVSKGKRALGLSPRFIFLELPLQGVPDGYKPGGILKVPALNRPIWDGAQNGDDALYLGVTCIVISKSAESVK